MLGAIAAPFPPGRAFAILVALALAALVAALLVAGLRTAGPVGGAVAAATFLVGADVGSVLWFSLIDGVSAALVVGAVATRGRLRVGLLGWQSGPRTAARAKKPVDRARQQVRRR